MAEEAAAAPTQFPWQTTTNDVVKALLAQQPPAQGAGMGEVLSPDQLNPWLKALEQDTTPTSSMSPMGMDSGQRAAPSAGAHQLASPSATKKLEAPTAQVPHVATQQIPVSAIVALQSHQISPLVDAARHRVMQVLSQAPRGIVPTTPVARG